MAGHGLRTVALGADPGTAAPRRVHIRADLITKITDFTIRYNRTAQPWKCAYGARAYFRLLLQPLAHEPASHQPLPQAA
jgi:hypothetical protein